MVPLESSILNFDNFVWELLLLLYNLSSYVFYLSLQISLYIV